MTHEDLTERIIGYCFQPSLCTCENQVFYPFTGGVCYSVWFGIDYKGEIRSWW